MQFLIPAVPTVFQIASGVPLWHLAKLHYTNLSTGGNNVIELFCTIKNGKS